MQNHLEQLQAGSASALAQFRAGGPHRLAGFAGLLRGLLDADGLAQVAVRTEVALDLPWSWRGDQPWDLVIQRGHLPQALVAVRWAAGPAAREPLYAEALAAKADVAKVVRSGGIGAQGWPFVGLIVMVGEDVSGAKAARELADRLTLEGVCDGVAVVAGEGGAVEIRKFLMTLLGQVWGLVAAREQVSV